MPRTENPHRALSIAGHPPIMLADNVLCRHSMPDSEKGSTIGYTQDPHNPVVTAGDENGSIGGERVEQDDLVGPFEGAKAGLDVLGFVERRDECADRRSWHGTG